MILEKKLKKPKFKKTECIRYLGIDFTTGIQDLKKINMGRIKKEVKYRLQKYKRLKLSWFNRNAV